MLFAAEKRICFESAVHCRRFLFDACVLSLRFSFVRRSATQTSSSFDSSERYAMERPSGEYIGDDWRHADSVMRRRSPCPVSVGTAKISPRYSTAMYEPS